MEKVDHVTLLTVRLQAEQLQREIEQRRKDMEYCFTSLVSDHVNGAYKTSAPSTQNHH